MSELNYKWNPVTFRILGVVFSSNVREIVLINPDKKLNGKKQQQQQKSCLTLGQEGTSPPSVRSLA